MNMKKTKMMFNTYILDHEININDVEIECVKKYIYSAPSNAVWN